MNKAGIMNQFLKSGFLCLSLFFVLTGNSFSQENVSADSLQNKRGLMDKIFNSKDKIKKNTILINVTNPMLISTKFFTVGYERVLPDNQSFSVSIGSFSIPRFLSDAADSLGLNTDYKDKGFHFSTDYRFYLKKENKYAAPHGIYIGPYYAYNYLDRDFTWYMDGTTFDGEVLSDIKLNIHTLGFELGYQFIFWDRLTLDMILFGPGFGSYKIKTGLKTTLTPDQESEFFDKLNQYLSDHLPGYDKVVNAGEFKRTGTYNTWDLGYRYSIRIGYRF